MGENGYVDTTPARLLIVAISACYGITLSRVLSAASLPQTRIEVHGQGVVSEDPQGMRVVHVVVSPALHGADCSQPAAYTKAAITARDECPIGRAIRGNVAYIVGPVTVLGDQL